MNVFFRIFTVFALSLFVGNTYAQRHGFDASCPDVHDPVMAKGEDGRYYIFSTGMGVGVMSSADMKTWQQEPGVFSFVPLKQKGEQDRRNMQIDWKKSTIPHWAVDSVRGYTGHTWAPDIAYNNGKWYLYYSCSTFGKNRSAIGVAVNKTLNPKSKDFKWKDLGPVVVSHQHKDNWNAIDPNFIQAPDKGGRLANWLVYGSFWDGLQLVQLAQDMKTPVTKPRTIARRIGRKLALSEVDDVAAFTIEGGDTIEAGENAIEAPFIIHRDGWYYLFVSWDYCCRGRNSTYKTVYGRSRNVEGPYLDKEGRDMAYGGGTYLVGPDDDFFGIGHCSAYEIDGQWWFLSHAYDIKKDGRSKLFLHKILFDKDGWMTVER